MEPEPDDGLSLEEISQLYTTGNERSEDQPDDGEVSCQASLPHTQDALPQQPEDEEPDAVLGDTAVCPESIVEAVLFVGHPDNRAISAQELAGLMRGVEADEIADIVQRLNAQYAEHQHAFRIVESPRGYELALAPDLHCIKDRFYGKVREIVLNQSAIDCLALIAYQPGISRERIERLRGQPSGGVLNQLVRRQLIELRRETTASGKAMACYYPTARFLELAGMESLDDLPQVEDVDMMADDR
ncbi:MAG: transcriptional regulator [Pirellulaceae bacterium]|nr:MAG: transcriptional regulator [Pirellulaceae bacterium]